MKTKTVLFAVSLFLLPAAPRLLAQANFSSNASGNSSANDSDNFSTNVSAHTSIAPVTEPQGRSKDLEPEQLILPARVKERLRITNEQISEFRKIEKDFAKTSREFKVANQPRIDAALEADRLGRNAKDEAQIQAARVQLRQVWAGLQPYRSAALERLKLLLTPTQLRIVEDPENQWTKLNPAS